MIVRVQGADNRAKMELRGKALAVFQQNLQRCWPSERVEYVGPTGPPAPDERIASRGQGVSPIMVGVVMSIFGWIILNTDLSPPPVGCQPGGRLAGSSACGIQAPIIYGVLLVVGGLIIIIAIIAVFLRRRNQAKAKVVQL